LSDKIRNLLKKRNIDRGIPTDGIIESKQIAATPLRMASMPIGMLHDLATGGLIRVGKNFMPRLRNAFTGSTIFNRAEVKPKPRKTATNTDNTNPENTTNPNNGDGNKDASKVCKNIWFGFILFDEKFAI